MIHIFPPAKPPESFLHVDEHAYQHTFSRGRQGSYAWLKSNRFNSMDALEIIRPPRGGCRVLSDAVVEDGGRLSPGRLSPILFEWGYKFFFGTSFVFGPNLTNDERDQIERDGQAIFSREIDTATDETLWKFIRRYRPIYAWRDIGGFWFTTTSRSDLKQLVNDERFQHAAEIQKANLRDRREQFWLTVGPEVGPERCVESHCRHLRIELAVRCIQHQFERFAIPGF